VPSGRAVLVFVFSKQVEQYPRPWSGELCQAVVPGAVCAVLIHDTQWSIALILLLALLVCRLSSSSSSLCRKRCILSLLKLGQQCAPFLLRGFPHLLALFKDQSLRAALLVIFFDFCPQEKPVPVAKNPRASVLKFAWGLPCLFLQQAAHLAVQVPPSHLPL